MSICAQRSGFLTLFACGEPAVTACARCGKMICGKHLHPGKKGQCCPDCAVIGMSEEDASRSGLDSSYHRPWDEAGAGMNYSDSDYGSFDKLEPGGGEMDGGGASGEWDENDGSSASDFQDS